MPKGESLRRLRVVVTDEETGERIIVTTGVETMALVVAPGASHGEEYRRVVVGDLELVRSLLLDTLEDVLQWSGGETVADWVDLDDLLQELLEEALEGLPLH
jgi:hypothetical protein